MHAAITMRALRFFFLMAFGALAACGSSTAAGPTTDPTEAGGPGITGPCRGASASLDASASGISNNSAELEGATFGQGTDPNDALRKVIRADELQPDARLTVARVHAMRTGSDTYVNIALSVTNASPAPLCFIQLSGFRLKDAAGTTLVKPDVSPFVEGSVLSVTTSLWTDTCLLPGETGWVIDIESADAVADLYGSLDAIEFTFSADAFEPDAVPAARVLPLQYEVAAAGIITVCFANLGTGPAEMTAQSFSRYLAFDDAGDPLDWDFLSEHIQPIGLLQPAQLGSASTMSPSFFPGTGHRMRAFIDFDSPGALSQLPSYASDPSVGWRRWRDRVYLLAHERHSSSSR